VSKYEYIDSQRADPAETNPVTRMCAWLVVSTSGFYHWLARPQSVTAASREALTVRVRHFFKAADGTYGYRRIHADLADENTECSPELVRQTMRAEGLMRKPRRTCRTSSGGTSPRIVLGSSSSATSPIYTPGPGSSIWRR
jgi:putative transposase